MFSEADLEEKKRCFKVFSRNPNSAHSVQTDWHRCQRNRPAGPDGGDRPGFNSPPLQTHQRQHEASWERPHDVFRLTRRSPARGGDRGQTLFLRPQEQIHILCKPKCYRPSPEDVSSGTLGSTVLFHVSDRGSDAR